VARHPVVDDLYTRRLESRDVERSSVGPCDLLEQEPAAVVLRTASTRWRSPRWPDGGEGLAAYLPRDGAEGRLRVEAVADDVFRIRYAESDGLPENATPMVVGTPPAPTRAEVDAGSGRTTLATPRARIEIDLLSLRLTARDAAGRVLTEIGGPEKNHLHAWDAYNTGICRTDDGRPLAVECFALHPQEGVFGFGERFLALDKVGQTVDLDVVEAMGTTTPRSYKSIPFFWTTRGWGLFLNHSARITCWVGSRAAADLQLAVEDDFLDYYLFVGTPRRSSRATPSSPAGARCPRAGASASGRARSPTDPRTRHSPWCARTASTGSRLTSSTSTPTGSRATGAAISSSTASASPIRPAS
jgi:hypothetical protein